MYKAILMTLFVSVMTGSVYAQERRTDFNGAWKIDTTKSEFSGAPSYTLSSALKISADANNMLVSRVSRSDSGADSVSVETGSFDGHVSVINNGNGMSKELHFTWSPDGKTLTEIFEYTGDDDEVVFSGTETWSLPGDSWTLLVTRNVKAASGFEYTVKGWYEKVSQ